MVKNLHQNERILRVAAGSLLASLAFWGPKNPLFLGGLILVGTGFVGTCPLYYSAGFSTRSAEEQANDYMRVQSDSEEVAGHPIVGVV